jgi:hypothetical protein
MAEVFLDIEKAFDATRLVKLFLFIVLMANTINHDTHRMQTVKLIKLIAFCH